MANKPRFTHLHGRVVETHARYASLGGGVPAEYHHEFWLRDEAGREFHVHLVDDRIPLRTGQRLEVLYLEGDPVALLNHSTNKYINLVPYAYYDLDSLFPKFPSLISFREIGIVIITLLVIGLAFEKSPLIGWFLMMLVCAGVLWRNRHRPQLVRNEVYYEVQSEILAARGK